MYHDDDDAAFQRFGNISLVINEAFWYKISISLIEA